MKFYKIVTFLTAMLLAGVSGCSSHAEGLSKASLELIAEGFTSPVAMIDPGDSSQRMFVVDQTGLIWILSKGERIETPLLDLRDKVIKLNSFYEERGLLGLAFHPDFARNGRFYVSYSGQLRNGLSTDEWDHTTYISEFTASASDPNQANLDSERVLLAMDKPGYNYEAGHIAFGPDGYLYIATGDSVHDPAAESGKFAQDRSSLLGKILRIDVNGTADSGQKYLIPADNPFVSGEGLPEIFAYGFRNPYRFSFDISDSGEPRLFVADVGQALMEEVDIVTPGGNYGWPIREGTSCFNTQEWGQPLESCLTSTLSGPIFAYTHGGNLSAIIGGGSIAAAHSRNWWGATFSAIGDRGKGACSKPTLLPLASAHGRSKKSNLSFRRISLYWGSSLALDRTRLANYTCLQKHQALGRPGTAGPFIESFQQAHNSVGT
jgi:glucose/arabinose dehydrogenase